MKQILKRLELIKTSITIEDEEIIALQVVKLKSLGVDEEVQNILHLLDAHDYIKGLMKIEEYVQKYSGIVVHEDKEVQALKLELKILEKKLQEISEVFNSFLNDINEFNIQYNLYLGDIIRKILKKKEELLQENIREKQENFDELKTEYDAFKKEINDLEKELEDLDEFDDAYDETYEELYKRKEELHKKRKETREAKDTLENDESFQEYEEVKEDYEEFSKEYDEIVSKEHYILDVEELNELKKLFRKASRLCHPDITTDEFKEQAHDVMAELNEAYAQKDLQKVKDILYSLESGTVFEVASDKINDKELLKAKIVEIRKKSDMTIVELEKLKEDETFIIIQEIDDWDDYFKEAKKQLEAEYYSLSTMPKNDSETDITQQIKSNTVNAEYWDELYWDEMY